MPDVPWQQRRCSFGAIAADYDRYRPSYPPAALDWVLARMGRGGPSQVLDVGAGTGALTRVLAAQGHEVLAVEPDARMRRRLRESLPHVTALDGTAEALPIADGSVDAVVAGQAWHWFDGAAAAHEFARVLRPGGVVGLLWNQRDEDVAWMRAYSQLVGGEGGSRQRWAAQAPTLGTPFTPAEQARFPHAVAVTADELVGLTLTASYVRLRPDADRIAERVRDLTHTHPDLAGRDRFELPYVTFAFRFRRR